MTNHKDAWKKLAVVIGLLVVGITAAVAQSSSSTSTPLSALVTVDGVYDSATPPQFRLQAAPPAKTYAIPMSVADLSEIIVSVNGRINEQTGQIQTALLLANKQGVIDQQLLDEIKKLRRRIENLESQSRGRK